jgi:HTH-type transcriptional regulator, cell division transcriptional repressor
MSSMSRRIAARRTELGMTQAELAQKLGLVRQTVSMWETGAIKDLQSRHLADLAKALQVPQDWILFGGEKPILDTQCDDEVIHQITQAVRRLPAHEREECLREILEREKRQREQYEHLKKIYGP